MDILDSVAGLATHIVLRRALAMEIPDIGCLRVMHPIDVLDSRVQDLDLIPTKRSPAGVSQASLAVEMVRFFIRAEITGRGERRALGLLEQVARIAMRDGAIRVFLKFGIDPLLAVPLDEFRMTTALHSRRGPGIVRALDLKREEFRRQEARVRKKKPRIGLR